jgi:Cdc6-like AAA superfamily ATPase
MHDAWSMWSYVSFILNAMTNKDGKLLFMYGSGGTGKTFVWTTLLSHLQGQGKIVPAVA